MRHPNKCTLPKSPRIGPHQITPALPLSHQAFCLQHTLNVTQNQICQPAVGACLPPLGSGPGTAARRCRRRRRGPWGVGRGDWRRSPPNSRKDAEALRRARDGTTHESVSECRTAVPEARFSHPSIGAHKRRNQGSSIRWNVARTWLQSPSKTP